MTSGDMSPSLNHYNNFSSVLLHKHGLLSFLLQAPCWEVLENVWSFQPGAHLVPITYRCGFKSQAVPRAAAEVRDPGAGPGPAPLPTYLKVFSLSFPIWDNNVCPGRLPGSLGDLRR